MSLVPGISLIMHTQMHQVIHTVYFFIFFWRNSAIASIYPAEFLCLCVLAEIMLCAQLSMSSAMRHLSTWLARTWLMAVSIGSWTSAGTQFHNGRWIAGKETGHCLSGTPDNFGRLMAVCGDCLFFKIVSGCGDAESWHFCCQNGINQFIFLLI